MMLSSVLSNILSKCRLSAKSLIVAAILASTASTSAQSSLMQAPGTDDDFDFELQSPAVERSLRPYVRTYMQEIAKSLYSEDPNVETMRGGEVVVVTIPTDELFVPNESRLLPGATKHLKRFLRFIAPDEKFKVVIAVHSDDTGSEEYSLDLTEARVNAILDFYESAGKNVDQVIGFPKGLTEPIESNATRKGRAANRRLEVYIVPDETLIIEARMHR